MSEFIFNCSTEAETVAHFCDRYCRGKFIIITGASVNSIGFEIARVLVKFGAEVFLTCRSEAACDLAVQTIRQQTPDALLSSHVMDLASFVSIRTCAEYIIAHGKPIHVLINNAGTMEARAQVTTDGFELQWQVNYLGPFYFTQQLLPLLIQAGTAQYPARVIMTSSVMNYIYVDESGIDFDGLLHESLLPTDIFQRYAESKLANILFAKELTRRMEIREELEGKEMAVIGVALHPGLCLKTNFQRSLSLKNFAPLCVRLYRRGTGKILRKEVRKTISQAASTTVYCALHPDIEAGEYYANCSVNRLVHDQANDHAAWTKLWAISEKQVANRLSELSATTSQFHPWHQL